MSTTQPTASLAGGGPAFPLHPGINPEWVASSGMSLRDYFAIHCDQPGAAEIVTAAGLVWSANQVWMPDDPDSPIGTFDRWWARLEQAERLALYAKVRYALADAMIAERAALSQASESERTP